MTTHKPPCICIPATKEAPKTQKFGSPMEKILAEKKALEANLANSPQTAF